MFNQVFSYIGRKVQANVYAVAISITVLLFFMSSDVVRSTIFGLFENKSHKVANTLVSTPSPQTYMLDGSIEQAFAGASNRINKSADAFVNPNKLQNGIHHTSVATFKTDADNNDRSFSNTKILYTPYMANSHSEYSAEKDGNNKSPPTASKSGKINSTYKSVTPSITDRVIADLKKEEYLAQQRAKAEADETNENDEAIYIDGDDDEQVNTPDTITEIETSVEKLPDDPAVLVQQTKEIRPESITKQKSTNGKKMPPTIGARDKKSSKKPTIISQKFKDFGFVAISDTDNSEAVDIDDDDYDDYANSGSGDFSNHQMVEQPNQDWIIPKIERIKPKKLTKQERIIKSFADNTYRIDDNIKMVIDTDAIDVVDKDDGQLISRKIAKAHRKQNAMQATAKTENQKNKPKSKQNRQKQPNANNKRKSKEQRYIDEYFSGAQTENSAESEGTKVQLVKVEIEFETNKKKHANNQKK